MRTLQRAVLLLAILLVSGIPLARARAAQSSKDALTNLRIVVTAGKTNQPVDNASVYIRFKESRLLRSAKKIEIDLKTNREGVATMRDLPRGDVIIQVVAPGWKTFGQHFKLEQAEQTIHIKLEEPPHWY